MIIRGKRPDIRFGRQLPGVVTILLLLVALIIFNSALVFLYVRVKANKEQELGQRLRTLVGWGRTELALTFTEMDLLPDDVAWIDQLSTEDRRELTSRLSDFAEEHSLERLIVCDSDLRVKLDTSGQIATNGTLPLSVVDSLWIEEALNSDDAVETLNYEVGSNQFKRAYLALRGYDPGSTDEEVVGLVMVEAQRRYFEPLRILRNFMILISALLTAALVGMAFLTHMALRRFVRLEQAMSHADRLQTLGTLAAGMAHEIRNPLGIIRITTEALRGEVADSNIGNGEGDGIELCDDILGEVDRVHDLIGRFLTFAKPGSAGEEPAEVGPVIRHAVRLSEKSATKSRIAIDVIFENGTEQLHTELPAASLQQVLFNLLRNAQESMSQAGRSGAITVDVRRVQKPSAVAITVTDVGVGMTPAQVRRAGEPFITTKADGTGLGLSITKNLLSSVQGRLEIVSRPGEGTRITATVPITSPIEIKEKTES